MVTDSHSILARWRNHFSQLFDVHWVTEVRQTEIFTAEPLVPEQIAFQFEMANEKLKRHKSPGTDQIPAEMIKARGKTIHSEIHRPIKPEEWKELIPLPIHKKDDKTGSCNYRGISLLPTTYKILSNILLSRLTPYAGEIIGDHQCGFQCNRSTTDHIFCIHQILEKKWQYSEVVHQLLIFFKKAYDSVRREVLYNICNEYGIPMKLVGLIRMCLNDTYSRVHVGKQSSDMFPVRNGLKQRDALLSLLFNFSLEYAIRRVQVNQESWKLNGTHQLLVYADDVNILGGSVHTIKENAEALVIASKETGLEVNADKN